MEIVTQMMSAERAWEEADWIGCYLRNRSTEDLIVKLGWGCRLPIENLWVDQYVPSDKLLDFIRNVEAQGIGTLGNADIFISDHGRTVTFLLCHEADIHLMTEDAAVADAVIKRWEFKKLRYERSKRSCTEV